MVRRPVLDQRLLRQASAYALPAVITVWALLVAWGTRRFLPWYRRDEATE